MGELMRQIMIELFLNYEYINTETDSNKIKTNSTTNKF